MDCGTVPVIAVAPAKRDAFFIISDSGTAQEEPALFNKPVIVPRDYSERPQSYRYNCSFKIDVNNKNISWKKSIIWVNARKTKKILSSNKWMGDGKTSTKIVKILQKIL